jgi:hypothetical protein
MLSISDLFTGIQHQLELLNKSVLFSIHTRNSCWRRKIPLEKKTKSFEVCYLVEGKQVWLPTPIFLFTTHFNSGFTGRAVHEVLEMPA